MEEGVIWEERRGTDEKYAEREKRVKSNGRRQ